MSAAQFLTSRRDRVYNRIPAGQVRPGAETKRAQECSTSEEQVGAEPKLTPIKQNYIHSD